MMAPIGPTLFLAMVTRETSPGDQRHTSASSRPVAAMKAQAKKRATVDGRNPAREVITGRPTIPPPMEHPAIRRIAPVR